MRDAAVAEALGVSRTPVREAMLRLAREGILENDPGRGFSVRRFTRSDAEERAEVVTALEQVALAGRTAFTEDHFRALEALNSELALCRDIARAIALDDEWHALLLEGCANQTLQRLLEPLRDATRRYALACARAGGRLQFATGQHAFIVASLREGDSASASARLIEHRRAALTQLLFWIDGMAAAPR